MIETEARPLTKGRKRRKEAMERPELLKVKKALLDALPPDLVKQYNITEGSYLEIDASDKSFTVKPIHPDEMSDEWIMTVYREVQEDQRRNPQTDEEMLEESRAIARYGAAQARKLGIDTSEENIQNIIYEFREQQS